MSYIYIDETLYEKNETFVFCSFVFDEVNEIISLKSIFLLLLVVGKFLRETKEIDLKTSREMTKGKDRSWST